MAVHIQRVLEPHIPVCVASRQAVCWAETVEGSLADNENWGFLSRYRSRLLLAVVPKGVDRNIEL